MLDYLMQQTDARIDKHSTLLAGQPRALAQAMILAESEQDQNERAMAQALLTAAAEDPELLAPAREKLALWFEQLENDDPSGLILVLAVEGLRFLTMLNLLPTGANQATGLYQLLLDAARKPAV